MIITERAVKTMAVKTRVPAGDYAVNPYIGCPHKCLYCYADFMRRFAGCREAWGDFLVVKRWAGTLNQKKLAGKKLLFGSVTDPYNPYEKRFRITRELLEQCAGMDIAVHILTKSDLLLRDLDLFKRIPRISAGVSLNTLDERVRRDLEPRASSIRRRINAVKRLHEAGLDTFIFVSPLFPGITDFKAILEECAGFTKRFYFENLNLRGAFRPRVLRYIQDQHPGLPSLYDGIYRFKNNAYWECLEQEIALFCRDKAIPYGSYFYHERIRKP
ncbi:MAG: radical SAM protein [Treponema sp.]|jgi:DNA repair photolyase|nr:radical SAM protein [Treponema sp.]